MTRSRDLQGIANSLVETFISRNNDVSGYWGIGKLYQETIAYSTSKMDLDLLARTAQPGGSIALAVAAHYADYLAFRLDGLVIAAASVSLEFGAAPSSVLSVRSTYGDPFTCSVLITSESGRTYAASRAGHCAPHSPRELRSSRAGSNNSFKPNPLRGAA